MSEQPTGWGALLSGKSGIRSFTLAGGVALHAINVYIVVTILPSLVEDIGGKAYYAWAATVFVMASLLGAALVNKVLAGIGPRLAYLAAALVFASGTFACALAPSMPLFLLARFMQGLGGGLLASLTYSMVRIIFARALWPRAMALISGMWGISTLLGPAIGGVFAEYGHWRAAFWCVGGLSVLFCFISLAVIPAKTERTDKATPLPLLQLVLLMALVFAISVGSVLNPAWAKVGGLLLGFSLLLLLAIVERHARYKILPHGAFSPGSALFPIYIIMLVMATPVNGAELFLPNFLQHLHNQGPLLAGYLAALMSLGWTCGSLPSAGIGLRKLPGVFLVAPALSLAGLGVLLFTIPGVATSLSFLLLISVALLLIGLGSGIIWPHLLTRVMQYASDEDAELASASITTVQLFATALSAALAGAVTNLAGLTNPGGIAGTSHAATALFTFLLLIVIMGLPFMHRIARMIRAESNGGK